MRIRWHLVVPCLVVSCTVAFLVGCGPDRRSIVIGSGVVTAGSSRSGVGTPSATTATPTAADSSTGTASPTTDGSSDGTASPTADGSNDGTAGPRADEPDEPPAECGPIPGQSGGGARAVPTPFRDDEAELDADGQTGDGRSVAVAEVQLSRTDGFVAVCTLDDRLLGLLPITRSNNERSVRVSLDEPITSTIEILVVLYADNGDGDFDWTTDPHVSGDSDDITDLETERLTYRYAA